MKVHRNNGIVRQCDGCYRYAKDLDELAKWTTGPGLPEAEASALAQRGNVATFTQVAQDRDYCPDCQ